MRTLYFIAAIINSQFLIIEMSKATQRESNFTGTPVSFSELIYCIGNNCRKATRTFNLVSDGIPFAPLCFGKSHFTTLCRPAQIIQFIRWSLKPLIRWFKFAQILSYTSTCFISTQLLRAFKLVLHMHLGTVFKLSRYKSQVLFKYSGTALNH